VSRALRVGIVGTGAITQVAHLPVLHALRGVDIAALCDNDFPKARALASRFEVPYVFDDIEDLLSHGDVDAVAVCSPNHLHESHTIAALSAEKHVLCERPLSLSVTGAERIAAAADRAARVVMVGMNHRFRRDVAAVRAFVAGGELGQITDIRGGWQIFRPSRQMLGWRLRREQAGGGALLDLGLPVIDLGLWIAGNPRPTRVSCVIGPRGVQGVEDSGAALVMCEGGITLFVDVSWGYRGPGERFWLDVRASRGSAGISPLSVFKEFHGTVTDVTPTGAAGRENVFAAAYRSEWEFFLAAVRGEVTSTSVREQVGILRLFQALYRSAEEGRDVTL